MILNAAKRLLDFFEWRKTMGYMLVKVTMITSKIRNIQSESTKKEMPIILLLKIRTLLLSMQDKTIIVC